VKTVRLRRRFSSLLPSPVVTFKAQLFKDGWFLLTLQAAFCLARGLEALSLRQVLFSLPLLKCGRVLYSSRCCSHVEVGFRVPYVKTSLECRPSLCCPGKVYSLFSLFCFPLLFRLTGLGNAPFTVSHFLTVVFFDPILSVLSILSSRPSHRHHPLPHW